MKITHVRCGRIFCLCSVLAVCIVLSYSHLEWLGKNRAELKKATSQAATVSSYKYHRNVYPTLKTELGNFEPKSRKPIVGSDENNPYYLPEDRAYEVTESYSEYGINIAASDEIYLNRSIPDTRLDECQFWHYPQDLPSTSVIIVFHNEVFSALMRTVHLVMIRSPPNLLHEVLLVDDNSDNDKLKNNLEKYIKRWKGKVRLIRNTQREGLIRTRSRGAQEAAGDVIVFLDAHCEVNLNWLPPLLAPIYQDYRTMTVPLTDGIYYTNFDYKSVNSNEASYRGIFEWGLLYKETEVPHKEASLHKHKSEPYKSPTHPGGLFAINKRYFFELGAYDPGLLVWGGENLELSFKIWQCGGSIEWVPCSKVGHVYRAFMPYSINRSLVTKNYKRIIETWFDEEHKEYFYTREPMAQFLDMGDISEQIALKERLQCKDFDWYMEKVAYDVYPKFPRLPKNVFWGMLRNNGSGTCLNTIDQPEPYITGTSSCHGWGRHQFSDSLPFRLNIAGQFGVGDRCIEINYDGKVEPLICRRGIVHGNWIYKYNLGQLIHRPYEYCLALQPISHRVSLAPCDPNNNYQQWIFSHQQTKW